MRDLLQEGTMIVVKMKALFIEEVSHMASISRDKNGTKRLVFNDQNRKRRFVRLGAINKKQSELIKSRVETIVSAKM